jgi:hypothetical protein
LIRYQFFINETWFDWVLGLGILIGCSCLAGFISGHIAFRRQASRLSRGLFLGLFNCLSIFGLILPIVIKPLRHKLLPFIDSPTTKDAGDEISERLGLIALGILMLVFVLAGIFSIFFFPLALSLFFTPFLFVWYYLQSAKFLLFIGLFTATFTAATFLVELAITALIA